MYFELSTMHGEHERKNGTFSVLGDRFYLNIFWKCEHGIAFFALEIWFVNVDFCVLRKIFV